MNLKQIECAITLSHTLNFRKAAELLFITQPALTYQIKSLEEEIGFQLFYRSGKGAMLTPAGEQCCFDLVKIKEDLKTAIERGKNYSSHYTSSLNISLPLRSALYYLPEIMIQFQKEFPHIVLNIHYIYGNQRIENFQKNEEDIKEFCEEEHCHCNESGIFKSALKHTINIFFFIVLVTFIINIIVYFIGEDNISKILLNKPMIGPIVSAFIGLIPNCAASVILTNMYLENVISVSSLISGLLTGAGVGLAVLFKTNKDVKNDIKVVILLYLIGVIAGIVLELIGFKI